MTAFARFPDRELYRMDDSAARHMATGDVIGLVDEVAGMIGERVGVVTRRVWRADGTLFVDCTDYDPIHMLAYDEIDTAEPAAD